MPRVGREVAMVLRVEREVTEVSRLKCEVAALLRVDRRLVGGGWVAFPFFRFSMTTSTYNTEQLTKINTKLRDDIHNWTFITYSFPKCKSFSHGFRGVNYSLILYNAQAAILWTRQ